MLCPCVLQPLLTAPCSARTIKPPLSRRLPPLVAPSRARAPAAGLGGGAGLPPQEDAGLPRPRRCAETNRLRWRPRAARWRHRTAGRPGTAPAPLGRPSKTYYSFPFIELIEMQFVKYIRRPAFLIRWIIQYEYFIRLFVFSPLPLGWVSCIYHQRDASLLQRNTCLGAGCGFMPHGQVFMWRCVFLPEVEVGYMTQKVHVWKVKPQFVTQCFLSSGNSLVCGSLCDFYLSTPTQMKCAK